MKANEFCLQALNSIYRNDPWIRQLYNAAGIYADDLADLLEIVYKNYFFDTADLKTVKRTEKEMKIIPLSSQTIEQRRKIIESKWKTNVKASVALLQSIADAWYSGGIIVDFETGKLIYNVQTSFIMLNMKYILQLLDEKKPAHLGYLFRHTITSDGLLKTAGIITSKKTINIAANIDFSFELESSTEYTAGFVRSCKVIKI